MTQQVFFFRNVAADDDERLIRLTGDAFTRTITHSPRHLRSLSLCRPSSWRDGLDIKKGAVSALVRRRTFDNECNTFEVLIQLKGGAGFDPVPLHSISQPNY